MELDYVELKIANYLENHTNKKKKVSMGFLKEYFDLTERQVRKIIERIILSQTLIIGNNDGYWVARNQEEIIEANRIQKARLKSSIKRLIANGGNVDFIFGLVNDSKEIFARVPEEQLELDYEQAE